MANRYSILDVLHLRTSQNVIEYRASRIEHRVRRTLELKLVAEIGLTNGFACSNLIRGTALQDLAVNQYVGIVTGTEGFSNVMIRDKYADSAPFKMVDDIFYIIDGQRIDARKGLIEQHK